MNKYMFDKWLYRERVIVRGGGRVGKTITTV